MRSSPLGARLRTYAAPAGAGARPLAGTAALLAPRSRRLRRRLVAAACAARDVVATTTQIGDFAREVGGDAVNVHQILQPNTDPHEYEPRPDDVEATGGAEVVFENGDSLDRWMGSIVSHAGGSPTVVDLGAACRCALPGESSGPEASRYDPHWWHDPRNAEAAVARHPRRAGDADPGARSDLPRRTPPPTCAAARARRRRSRAASPPCPPRERKLVSDHDAFGYFARRYGIAVVGAVIPSQTTQAQPSAGDLARLVRLIRREHVRAVFPESSLNPKLAQAIARETGARAATSLYGDTLGPAGSRGRDLPRRWNRRMPTRWCAASRAAARRCRIGGAAMTLAAPLGARARRDRLRRRARARRT